MELLLIGICIGLFMAAFVVRSSYRNGVTDGYGYAREPHHPGYQVAGDYLRQHMRHRWPDLLGKINGESVGEASLGDDAESAAVCSECRECCSSDCRCWCHGPK